MPAGVCRGPRPWARPAPARRRPATVLASLWGNASPRDAPAAPKHSLNLTDLTEPHYVRRVREARSPGLTGGGRRRHRGMQHVAGAQTPGLRPLSCCGGFGLWPPHAHGSHAWHPGAGGGERGAAGSPAVSPALRWPAFGEPPPHRSLTPTANAVPEVGASVFPLRPRARSAPWGSAGRERPVGAAALCAGWATRALPLQRPQIKQRCK